jgi:hypothetical protein
LVSRAQPEQFGLVVKNATACSVGIAWLVFHLQCVHS